MKKMLCTVLVLCLLAAMLPVMALPAQAASGKVENCLQFASYYNPDTGEWGEYEYPCVLVTSGNANLVITVVEPKDGFVVAFSNAASTSWYGTDYVGTLYDGLYVYKADSSCGAAEGFLPVGSVTQNEVIRYVGFDSNWEPKVAETVALDYVSGTIIPKDSVSTKMVIAVINEKDEMCAVAYDGICIVLGDTTEESFYGSQGSNETEPSATEPPATEPPATEPPATEPHATEPQSPGGDLVQGEEKRVRLQDLDKIYENAVVKKKPSESGTIAIAVIAVVIVALLAGVILVKRRNKTGSQDELDEAEEGTVLADVPMDTGVRLQFRDGKRIAVKKALTIGRAPENDVVIPAAYNSVSGRHCQIIVQNGAVYLRDLGSTNGTYINGKRIAVGQLIQLLPGMTVGLGTPNGPEGFRVDTSRS